MSISKIVTAAVVIIILSQPALAGNCYSTSERGSGKYTAGSVLVTYKNEAKNGLATYIEGPDGEKERIWLKVGQKVERTFDIRRTCKPDDTSCGTTVHNAFVLTYSPLASEVDLLKFKISNKREWNAGDFYKSTTYSPNSKQPNNVSCDRSFRSGKQRWDLDIKFK